MAATDRTAVDAPTPKLRDFQQVILHILADGPQHGLGVKRDLGKYYAEEVNHGRLYPNLDELVDLGFIAKSERDKRTNEYRLTEDGRRWLQKRRSWEDSWWEDDRDPPALLTGGDDD